MNELIFFVTVSVFILGNIALAFIWKGSGPRTFITFIADPDRYSAATIALTLTGTIVGGGMFLAIGQIGYESFYAGIVLGVIYLIGLSLVGVLAPRIRTSMAQKEIYSLIDYLRIAYNEKVVAIFCVVNFLMYLFLLAGQFVAMFQFLQFVNGVLENKWIPYVLIGLTSISIFLIPIVGGLRKDIQTDILQMFIKFVALSFVIYQLISIGDFSLSSSYYEVPIQTNNYGLIFIVGAVLFLTPSFFVRMDIWQRINAAKSDQAARNGFIIAGVLSFLFFVLFTILGMWANHLKMPDSKFATLSLIFTVFQNPLLLSLIVGAFFAAVLSAADTLLNNTSIFATKLLFAKQWQDKSSAEASKALLSYSRIIGLIVFLLSVLIGILVPNMVDLLVGAFSLLLIFLPTILGLFIPPLRSSNAAVASTSLGLASFILLFAFWNPKLAFAPAVLLSIVTYFVAFFFTRKTAPA